MSYETNSLLLLMKTIHLLNISNTPSLSNMFVQCLRKALDILFFNKMMGSFGQWGIVLRCTLQQIQCQWMDSGFNLTNRINVECLQFLSEYLRQMPLTWDLIFKKITEFIIRYIWKSFFIKNKVLNWPRSLVFYSF